MSSTQRLTGGYELHTYGRGQANGGGVHTMLLRGYARPGDRTDGGSQSEILVDAISPTSDEAKERIAAELRDLADQIAPARTAEPSGPLSYRAYEAARDRARAAYEVFVGDNNWPGFGKHDRSYALPVVNAGDTLSVLVCVDVLPHVEVHFWPGGAGASSRAIEDWGELSAVQLSKLIEIKAMLERYVEGTLDVLPPSTCRRFAPERSDR